MSRRTRVLAIVGAIGFFAAVIAGLASLAGFAFVRSGTDVVADTTSPDGKWDAMLMVRNGGATTDYSTQVSVIPARNWFAREFAIGRPGNAFIAGSNHGAVGVDRRGLMNVTVTWASANRLIVTYPPEARVFRREPKVESVTVEYPD